MDKLKEFLSNWVGWPSVVAILLLIAAALSERVRKFFAQVLADYVAAHWRHIWYWATNRVFLASGHVKYAFASGITADQKLIDKFESLLRNERSAQVTSGSLRDGIIELEMSEMRNVKLELSTVTGELLAQMYPGGAGGASTDEGAAAAPMSRTEMSVKWDKIVVRYREIRGTFDSLRQTVDAIKDAFATVVEGKAPEQKSAYLSVCFRRDCAVDRSVQQEVPVSGGAVTVRRMKGETNFGAPTLDAITPYLPSYLVRETIADLMKGHKLTT